MLEALCHMAKTYGHMQIYWEHTTTARCDHTIGWKHITTGGRHMQMAAQHTVIRFKHIAAGPCYITTRSEEHTSELQSLMRISYAVFCLKKKNTTLIQQTH